MEGRKENEEINRRKKEQNTEQKTEGIKERKIERLTGIQNNRQTQTGRHTDRHKETDTY